MKNNKNIGELISNNKVTENNIGINNDIVDENIVFKMNFGATEVLKFCENGDIFIHGKLAENDKEVVEGMRKFLKQSLK